jgi:hypothetical protein
MSFEMVEALCFGGALCCPLFGLFLVSKTAVLCFENAPCCGVGTSPVKIRTLCIFPIRCFFPCIFYFLACNFPLCDPSLGVGACGGGTMQMEVMNTRDLTDTHPLQKNNKKTYINMFSLSKFYPKEA